jgi:hypothetical protein
MPKKKITNNPAFCLSLKKIIPKNIKIAEPEINLGFWKWFFFIISRPKYSTLWRHQGEEGLYVLPSQAETL